MLETKKKRIYEIREEGSYTKEEFMERKDEIENEISTTGILSNEARIEQIDGENFKGKIRSVYKETRKSKPVWHEYNFEGLLDKVLTGIAVKRKIFYFARIKEHEQTKENSRELIEEQRLLKIHLEKQGFEVVLC